MSATKTALCGEFTMRTKDKGKLKLRTDADVKCYLHVGNIFTCLTVHICQSNITTFRRRPRPLLGHKVIFYSYLKNSLISLSVSVVKMLFTQEMEGARS